MRFPNNAPTAGAFLRWGGLLAVVLAIIGGIMGMHVVNGAPAVASAHSGMSAAMMEQAMTKHSSSPVHLAAEAGHSTSASALGQVNAAPECECSSDGCAASMAMHGDCTPTVSPPVLNLPLPGTLSTHAPGTGFAVAPGHKSSDRIPDPPSLEKLSISRT
ncbi:hypothetical protein AS189_11705 [Arthrobacter alpinus]|uniref:Uncharacterized protein n=1 Tax=Arthrobacter alpinus TaxID=656366 RepID=A0A0S2M015_9MICC|nr:DUF6153 family protein [Arthrobacter alpinus]ALO67039.1 hypothetical protein AS189_11705 [Arthrobacter alpinus]